MICGFCRRHSCANVTLDDTRAESSEVKNIRINSIVLLFADMNVTDLNDIKNYVEVQENVDEVNDERKQLKEKNLMIHNYILRGHHVRINRFQHLSLHNHLFP